MPLMDHFHPPLSGRRHWEAFHARWASAIADALNAGSLPAELFAEPTVHIGGQVQVDVATLEDGAPSSGNGGVATLPRPMTTIPTPTWTIPAAFTDTFEVQIINSEAGPKLVAAIELVSPSNKDRPQTRRAFAVKCASYLCQGIHVIIMDVVTSRSANLHNEIMCLMETDGFRQPPEARLYSVAYRPVRRDMRDEIDVWPAKFALGDRLPSLPLYLAADLAVMVDFEATYQETCQRLRLGS